MRVCICAAQVPFATGGAELLVESLRAQLVKRGVETDVVSVPLSWVPHQQVLKSAFAWRLLELQQDPRRPIDLVIGTKFPSYLIRHPNKVLWLVHQFRQVYDLLGTPYSDFGDSPDDQEIVKLVREMDGRALRECRTLFAIAKNAADRLRRFNGLEAQVLYPPPPLDGRYRAGAPGDYVFGVGRLDGMKRFDLLIKAMAHAPAELRARIAGDGPDRQALEGLIDRLGLRGRVQLLGRVGDERLIDLFAGSLGVYYAPYDEDFGYVTIEAFLSHKPVITAADSGGPLEFVSDGANGFVVEPSPAAVGAALTRLATSAGLAGRLGNAGFERARGITWDAVIDALIPSGLGRSRS